MAEGARVVRLGPYPGREGEELGLLVEPGAEARVVRVAWLPGVDPDGRAALSREIDRAAEALHHPHIQPPIALEEIDGRLAMVLDHAEGETLAEILSVGGRMPPPIAARVIRDACRAIHFAHEEGQDDGLHLHGWLRPANVLVTRNGVSLVSGFGVGLARAPADLLPWQSPEQILGGPRVASRASDVYCLGLLLHAALSGENPFAREPDPDVAILSRPAPSLEPLGVPPGLAAVARRALSVKGADRFPSAAEMGKAIDDSDVKVASPAEVAAWVESLFPAGMGMRALRQRAAEAAREAARSPAAAGEPPATVVEMEEIDEPLEAPEGEPLEAEPPVQPPPAARPVPAGRGSPAEPELFPGDFVAVGPAFLGGRDASASTPAAPVATAVATTKAIPPGAVTPALEDELPELEEVAPSPVAVAARPSGSRAAEGRSPTPLLASAAVLAEPGPTVDAPARRPTPGPVPAEPGPGTPAAEPPAPPPPRRRTAPARALVGVALAAAVGGAVGWWVAGSERDGAKVAPAAPAVAVPQAAPPVPPSAGAAAPVVPAPQAAQVPAPPPAAPAPAEAVAGRPVLEITSSSPGDLIVDGRRAGRPPYSHPVRGGRHEVRLVNRALGFDVSRKVDVRPPRTALRIEVGKGRLTVAAPPGADIFLDGRLVGRGQLKDLEIWEGRHQLLVRLGAAQNEHDFEVGPQETYEYEVTAQVRP